MLMQLFVGLLRALHIYQVLSRTEQTMTRIQRETCENSRVNHTIFKAHIIICHCHGFFIHLNQLYTFANSL